MTLANHSHPPMESVNPFVAEDVVAILDERGWLIPQAAPPLAIEAWCSRAAAILGLQVTEHSALGHLLALVFTYDARVILSQVESHEVLARYAAREVLRRLALFLLDGGPLDSDRFKWIINQLKEEMELRGRLLFHPIRLALAGRVGGGELDRVILLLDEAALLPFAVRVKSTRERILEFCSALD